MNFIAFSVGAIVESVNKKKTWHDHRLSGSMWVPSANICDLDFYPEYSNIGKLWPETQQPSKQLDFIIGRRGEIQFAPEIQFQILVSSRSVRI